MCYPWPSDIFIVDADTSTQSRGGVLSQEYNCQEHGVAYYGQALNRPENHYCVTRKELFAVVKQ